MRKRTESERKAYIEGFERCADCLKEYLNNEGKKMLKGLLLMLENMKGEENT